jgi:hypothetical protein
MTQPGPRKNRGAHGEHDDAGRPAVDEVVVSTNSHALHNDFRREVVRRPTCRLLQEIRKCTSRKQSTGKGTDPELSETVVRLGETKVGNFDDWWVVFCQKHVLRN